jgi:hypothetical protein
MKRRSRDVDGLGCVALVGWLLAWLASETDAGMLRWLVTTAGVVLLGLLLLAIPMVCFGLFVCLVAWVVFWVGSGMLTGAEKVATLVERHAAARSGGRNAEVVPAPGLPGRGDELIPSAEAEDTARESLPRRTRRTRRQRPGVGKEIR